MGFAESRLGDLLFLYEGKHTEATGKLEPGSKLHLAHTSSLFEFSICTAER